MSAIKLFSPLKISSNALQSLITKFRLKHLANVTVFYFAVLYIFALVGVHQIGPLDYHCVSDDVNNNNTTLKNMTLKLCWIEEDDESCGNCTDDESCGNHTINTMTGDRNDCVSLASLSIPDIHCRPCCDSDCESCR